MKWFDGFIENGTRRAARNVSRRSALARIGRLLVGTAFALPVLPFDRVAGAAPHAAAAKPDKRNDDTACEYWRYCALDGFLFEVLP